MFRQSYGYEKLTPFNYESPPELRGKGGLDIDVGFLGIVNNGDTNAKISFGVETGLYENDINRIPIISNILPLSQTYMPFVFLEELFSLIFFILALVKYIRNIFKSGLSFLNVWY